MGTDMRNKISIRLQRSYQSCFPRITTTLLPNLPSRRSAVIRGAVGVITAGAGAKQSIPLSHDRARGAAVGWPAIARDHFCLHDARVVRIDGLVEGSRNRLRSTWDRVIRALLDEDGAVPQEVRHVWVPTAVVWPPRLHPDRAPGGDLD